MTEFTPELIARHQELAAKATPRTWVMIGRYIGVPINEFAVHHLAIIPNHDDLEFIFAAAVTYEHALAEIIRLQEIERQAIEQSEHIQQAGLTDFEVAGLRAEIEKLREILSDFLNAVPLDVLRMQAGNAYLDMERVDAVAEKARKSLAVRHD